MMLKFTTLSDDVNCFECGKSVPYANLEEHMVKSHAYRRCTHCNLLFHLNRLDEHIRRYHGIIEKTIPTRGLTVLTATRKYPFQILENTFYQNMTIANAAFAGCYVLKKTSKIT